mmetsp:Transcript_46515/g.132640  ORF Transcript_46515/g.132640 Transcript_46515/m.132640 type:complete len:206 (-) Transcript_46515:295-912(-)
MCGTASRRAWHSDQVCANWAGADNHDGPAARDRACGAFTVLRAAPRNPAHPAVPPVLHTTPRDRTAAATIFCAASGCHAFASAALETFVHATPRGFPAAGLVHATSGAASATAATEAILHTTASSPPRYAMRGSAAWPIPSPSPPCIGPLVVLILRAASGRGYAGQLLRAAAAACGAPNRGRTLAADAAGPLDHHLAVAGRGAAT